MTKEQFWKTFGKLGNTLWLQRNEGWLQFLEGKPESITAVCSSTGVGTWGVGGATASVLEVNMGSKAIMEASAGSFSWEHLVFHQLLQRLHLSDVILF